MNLASIGINRNLLIKAGIDNVKTGDFLYIKVLSLEHENARISVNGKTITVKNSAILKLGQTLRVKAVWNGNLLELKTSESGIFKLPSLLSGYFKSDSESAAVLTAMKNAGLSFKDENVKNMVKVLSRLKSRGPGKSRLAAEMLKKGLIADDTAIAYIEGDSSEQNNDKENNPYHELFNSIASDDVNWIILPYSLKGPEHKLAGSLKLKYRKNVKLPESAVIEASVNEEKYFFMINNPCRRNQNIEIYSSQDGRLLKKSEIRNELAENLRNLGIKIDDNINDWCFDKSLFDGFSPVEKLDAGFEEIV